MAQSLSDEEFNRMQAQLLELRKDNYQLTDEVKKNQTELNVCRNKVAVLEKDLAKAQKTVAKSKKAQEVEALLGENEMLQAKLRSQEEDFGIQNTTLMQELNKLCSQLEQLEEEKRAGKDAAAGGAARVAVAVDGEIRRLRAENAALLKNIAALQDKHIHDLEKLGESRASVNPAEESDEADGQVVKRDWTLDDGDTDGDSDDVAKQLQRRVSNLEAQLKEFNDLQLKFATEKEENELLKDQIQAMMLSKEKDFAQMQEDISKVTDKLKKKQESLLQLQSEKESLYTESRSKLEEVQRRNEEEIGDLNVKMQKVQNELKKAMQDVGELKEQLKKQRQERDEALKAKGDENATQIAQKEEQMGKIRGENEALRTSLAALEQIQTTRTVEINLLKEQNMSLTEEVHQLQLLKSNLVSERESLTSQYQEAAREKARTHDRLQELSAEKVGLQADLEEANKLAVKRKSMLDALAIETQQEKGRHKEALSTLQLAHDKEVLGVRARYERELRELHEEMVRSADELRAQLKDEKMKTKELEGLKEMANGLQSQIAGLESSKGWYERRLQDAEELAKKNLDEHQGRIQQLQEQHRLDSQRKMEEAVHLKQELENMLQREAELKQEIEHLKQELKDVVDQQRIVEKKGSAALKDLKRQLQLERKRADRVQERLQDFLTNSKMRAGMEELNLSDMCSPTRTQTGDSSSISSFSYRDIMRETPSSSKHTESPHTSRPADLSDDEVTDMFQRIAELQQEKWNLEEKVKHLEANSSSMAEDICKKNAIIEAYVMESRIDTAAAHAHAHAHADRSSIGSVFRDLVKPGDDSVRDMNKKLQHMLEEQLTKNMYLQKDMELLSQEVVRLSKGPSVNNETS
ncbi:GRIP1-associated protein 1 isoform X2 [Lampetra planeri]